MCDVGYLCANFSLPRPLCSRLRLDVRDRQTEVRCQTDRRQTRCPYPTGGGIIKFYYACMCAGLSKRTLKRERCCFWIWLRPCYKIPEIFTIVRVLTSILTVCRRNRGDPSSLYRTWGALVRYKYYRNKYSRFGLAWNGQNLISWRWSLSLPTNPVW